MLTVTKDFKQAVAAPSRKVTGRVRFEILDNSSYEDVTINVSNESALSHKEQLTNKIRVMSNKYAVLEKDYLKLDGSFTLPATNDGREYGWWGNQPSDELGNLLETITFSFTEEHSSVGLSIYFDVLNNEYATEFDIDVYDLSNNLILHDEIIDNTESEFMYTKPLDHYAKIIITLKKWSKPFQRAKITEVDFGIVKEYSDSNLVEMNILQEIDLTSSTLPTDELTFTVDNSNREFNLLNPNGFYEYLNQGQEVFPELGVEVDEDVYEWVQVGKYYLNNWESEDNQLTAKFTARDVIDSLTNEVENTSERSLTLYDLAHEVMQANDVEDYEVTENLRNITTKGIHDKVSYRDLLQLIAIAGRSVVYADNLGKLNIKQLQSIKTVIREITVNSEAEISSKKQVLNNILEPSFNILSLEKDRISLDGSFEVPQENMASFEVGWWSDGVADENGVFNEPPQLEITTHQDHASINFEILFDVLNDEYASEFDLRVYDDNNHLVINETIFNDSSQFRYQNNLLEDSRKIEIVIKKWSKGFRRARIVEVGFDFPVAMLDFENMYTEPKVTLNDSVKTVEVNYYTGGEEPLIYTITNSDMKTGQVLKVDNTLINDLNTAKEVANWLMAENSRVVEYEVDWRQNPALELADKIGIENRYVDSTIGYVTSQEMKYQGYLSGVTKAKGGI